MFLAWHLKPRSNCKLIEEGLDQYPVIDEEDLSKREYENFVQCWNDFACKGFCEDIGSALSLTDEGVDALKEVDKSILLQIYIDQANNPYECNGNQCMIRDCQKVAEKMDVSDVMRLWFITEKPSRNRHRLCKWLETTIEQYFDDSTRKQELKIPLLLTESSFQAYLFGKRWLRAQRKQLRNLLGF